MTDTSYSMFEKASRLKVRFDTPKGNITVEDLWDLPLSHKQHRFDLDTLAKTIYREVKDSEEGSFVKAQSKANELLNLKFNLVKHVIAVKLEEERQARAEVADRQRKEQIKEIIAKKKNQELEQMSIEDLEKQL